MSTTDLESTQPWQEYVDDKLMCGYNHKLFAAAILAHDGCVKAKSPDFPQVTDEEITVIMSEFTRPGTITGFHFGEQKYIIIQGDPGAVIRGNRFFKHIVHRKWTICIMKTKETLIIGVSDIDELAGSESSMVVEKLGDELVAKGL